MFVHIHLYDIILFSLNGKMYILSVSFLVLFSLYQAKIVQSNNQWYTVVMHFNLSLLEPCFNK